MKCPAPFIMKTTTTATASTVITPAGAANTQIEIEIETYRIKGGSFQLRFKRSWDGSLYIEVGDAWPHTHGFGHPRAGRHTWEIRGFGLHQQLPWTVNLHYPISVSEDIKRELLRANR